MRKGVNQKKFRLPGAALLYILPGLAGFVVFYIGPFIISLAYSFLDKPINGVFVGLRNYMELFRNQPYLLGLKNTLIYIGTSLPVNITLSLAAALMINQTGKNKHFFTLIFLIPLVIPSGSMIFFWKMLFADAGFLNGLLNAFNQPKINWLSSQWSRSVVTLIFLWKNLGYNVILFLSGLSAVPKEYYEAARVDGAGTLRCFFKITVPFLLPMSVLVVIMSLINSFKVFKEIYLLTGNYPHESVYMLQHFMNNMFNSLQYPKLTTATTILVTVIALLTQFLLRFERRHQA